MLFRIEFTDGSKFTHHLIVDGEDKTDAEIKAQKILAGCCLCGIEAVGKDTRRPIVNGFVPDRS